MLAYESTASDKSESQKTEKLSKSVATVVVKLNALSSGVEIGGDAELVYVYEQVSKSQ